MKQKIIGKINKTKSWSFKRINQIDKPLARLTKIIIEKTQISKIIHEKGDITTDKTKIKKNIRGYYEKLYSNKLDNLKDGKILRNIQIYQE